MPKRLMDFISPALIFIFPLAWATERIAHPGPWIGFLAYVVILLTQPHLGPKEMATSTGRDKLSALGIYAAVIIPMVVSVVNYGYRSEWLPPVMGWQVFLGAGMAISGLVFRVWAIRTLGKFFTSVVMVQDDQKVIQTGPYKVLRHPSYTGAFVVALGVTIGLGSMYGTVLAVLMIIPAYLHRIRAEEKALMADLGDEYREYKKRSWGLIPYLF